MLRPPPTPTLLPYTTLFRSCRDDRHPCADAPGGSSYRQAVRQEEPVLVDDVDDMRLAVHLVHEPLPLQLGKAGLDAVDRALALRPRHELVQARSEAGRCLEAQPRARTRGISDAVTDVSGPISAHKA